jgi:hypothetical protein
MDNTLGILFGCIGALTTMVAWLWRHSARLTAAEVRIEGLQHRLDSHTQEVSSRLQNIENKLDRMIERGIGNQ